MQNIKGVLIYNFTVMYAMEGPLILLCDCLNCGCGSHIMCFGS